MWPCFPTLTKSESQAVASREATSSGRYGSFSLATNRAGNGRRESGIGRKSSSSRGDAALSVSHGGAAKNAPLIRCRRRLSAAQCATARQPRLCATRTTGPSVRSTSSSIRATHSARGGRVQFRCSTRRKFGYCSSQSVCQWPAPDPFQPGMTRTFAWESISSRRTELCVVRVCTCMSVLWAPTDGPAKLRVQRRADVSEICG